MCNKILQQDYLKGDIEMKSYFWDIETSTIISDEGIKMQVTF